MLEKIFKLLLVLLLLSGINLFANDSDKTKLPKLLGTSSAGTEFYFSFIPAWESEYEQHALKIFISSNTRTKVKVEVEGKNFVQEKYTIPNDIIEFSFDTKNGQPVMMTTWKQPGRDSIYRKSSVHISSEYPIICYAVSNFKYNAEGFLVIPVDMLGSEYIVASFADVSTNDGQWLPSLTSITATQDNTEVKFTLGGNSITKTAGGLNTGEQSIWTLNRGDVLLISSLGSRAELTGSKIESSMPVSVVSGNFCAYVPTECGCCDLIEEMEMPTYMWGTKYHVAPIYTRKKNSIIKIFAKEENTKIFRDYLQIGEISTSGGRDSTGFLHMRAVNDSPRPVVISGDKPISVTQFNTSQMDDFVAFDPFQMVLVPTELYQKEVTFHTPDLYGDSTFIKKYINICYNTNGNDTIPKDLKFAKFKDGDLQWIEVASIDTIKCNPFAKNGNDNYYYTTIELDKGGVYKVKADLPFQVYSYGTSYLDSYGFPASIGEADFIIGKKDEKLFSFSSFVSVYPNPANDILMLENIPENCYKILIYDVNGKEVNTINVENEIKRLEIQTDNMLQGFYFMKFIMGNESKTTMFFVVK